MVELTPEEKRKLREDTFTEQQKINWELAERMVDITLELQQRGSSFTRLKQLYSLWIKMAIKLGEVKEDILLDFDDGAHDRESLVSWSKSEMLRFKLNPNCTGLLDTLKIIGDGIITESVVYLIKNPLLGIHKIGISKDVIRRLRQLISACGVNLELVTTYESNYPALEMESRLHYHFRSKRLKGEWFKEIDKDLFESACTEVDRK